jgi:very-short-patch-repair endonuclease
VVSLDAFCKAKGWPIPDAEVRFHPTRKWRFDWAWADQKLALEIDGGVWVRGAHGRGTGIVRDQEKGREAAALGWRIIRCQPKELFTPGVLDAIHRALQWRTEAV